MEYLRFMSGVLGFGFGLSLTLAAAFNDKAPKFMIVPGLLMCGANALFLIGLNEQDVK